MAVEEPYIELRVPHPQTHYVALIGGVDARFGLQRLFDPFWAGPDRYPGTLEMIHHLLNMYAVYEIKEVVNGQNIYHYIATAENDATIYPISRDAALSVAHRRISIPELLRTLQRERAV